MAKYYVLSKRNTIFKLHKPNEWGNRAFDILGDYTEIIGVFFNREQARARQDDVLGSYVKQGQFEVHWRLHDGQEINDVFKIDLHECEEYEKSGRYPYIEIHSYPFHENVERYYDANMLCTITVLLEEKEG